MSLWEKFAHYLSLYALTQNVTLCKQWHLRYNDADAR
jgi:hypothetical protein